MISGAALRRANFTYILGSNRVTKRPGCKVTVTPMGIDPRQYDLLRVSAAVDAAPPDSFNMLLWLNVFSCKTGGCAIGWFIHRNPYDDLRFEDSSPALMGPVGVVDAGFGAIAARFHIPLAHAQTLFSARPPVYNQSLNSRESVAARIRTYVKNLEEHCKHPAGFMGVYP